MLMMIFQYRIENTTEDELEEFKDFSDWLCSQLRIYIDTKTNRKKIYIRLKHLYSVDWITWKNKKEVIGVEDIMCAIKDSFIARPYINCTYKIEIDTQNLIPNTITSIDRLIRFLEYGDTKVKGTDMFTGLKKHYDHKTLNTLWRFYVLQHLGYLTQSKIITD